MLPLVLQNSLQGVSDDKWRDIFHVEFNLKLMPSFMCKWLEMAEYFSFPQMLLNTEVFRAGMGFIVWTELTFLAKILIPNLFCFKPISVDRIIRFSLANVSFL
jgi:hypothetical protein